MSEVVVKQNLPYIMDSICSMRWLLDVGPIDNEIFLLPIYE